MHMCSCPSKGAGVVGGAVYLSEGRVAGGCDSKEKTH